MRNKWSKHWKASKNPKKQRKYRFNLPLHRKKSLVSTHLPRELIKKYKRRNTPLRKGDTVKIIRGQFKNTTGKVERIDLKKQKAYITGVQTIKKDGTKTYYPIHSSNLIIQELYLDDKKRRMALERNLGEKKNG